MTGQVHWLPVAWVFLVAATIIVFALHDVLNERRRHHR
jgi:hypothetical protein